MNHYIHIHKQINTIYTPTNVILGVANTFFVAVAAAILCTVGVGLATGFVTVEVAVEVLAVVAVLLAVGVTTTGSVDGIGLPSLVCNFNTLMKIKQKH